MRKFENNLEWIRTKMVKYKVPSKAIFIVVGILSTIWFLVRVIPKPSRAGYPCVKAATPFMSGFVIWLFSLTGSVFMFRKSYDRIKKARYIAALGFVLVGLVFILVSNYQNARKIYANSVLINNELPDAPNTPMGQSYGSFPGRVVWTFNPSATNDSCKNTMSDAYYLPQNNNQDTIDVMANYAVKALSGKTTIKDAWDAIFKDFNLRKKGAASGYEVGQTIFIKINNGQAGWAINMNNLAESRVRAPISGTSPAALLAFVRQLVDSCAIPQNKILIGEPMTHVYKHTYDVIHAAYPDVVILDKEDHTNLGRTTSAGWTDDVVFYSDKGKFMPDGISDNLMKEMYDADYMINFAALKAHARNGFSVGAKNHLGSHGKHGDKYGYGTFYLHSGLVATKDNDDLSNTEATKYKRYRVCVDMMGHEKLGLNTVLFIVDGLWGGTEAVEPPVKWNSAPFNNDWPNSFFIAQDQVAIESVCLDFLRAEALVNPAFKKRPLFPAVDDYLHQAADKTNWPEDIIYDPEADGVPISSSLGVHEHWNNSTDKQYTQNLFSSEDGIDLVAVPENMVEHIPKKIKKKKKLK
ncbi:MAG: DUF362 domain-containing protein [Prolixibacteraceae bacterium]|jgi:hypothetical protein|nr:DUF362 domain-containing protein [Prolixibacteraceae bacterium]